MADRQTSVSAIPEAVPGVKGQAQPAESATPLLEWIVAGFGLLLLLGVLSFLVIDALVHPPAGPEIAIEVQSILRAGNGHLASFKAINRGGENAAAVVIEGELRRAGTRVEHSWVTLDYLPSRSAKTAGLFFTEDPRDYELVIRPRGYVKP